MNEEEAAEVHKHPDYKALKRCVKAMHAQACSHTGEPTEFMHTMLDGDVDVDAMTLIAQEETGHLSVVFLKNIIELLGRNPGKTSPEEVEEIVLVVQSYLSAMFAKGMTVGLHFVRETGTNGQHGE